MVTCEGRVLSLNESLSYWALFPSTYSFRAGTGTLYSIVQPSSLFAAQKEGVLYCQGAGVGCLRENSLQTMKKERELGTESFPVMLLYSISSSS